MSNRKGARTRARIIESGLELFLSQGTTQVSLRQIAGAAGITPMAIYRHFDDKLALQFALLQSAFEMFESYLSRSDQVGTARQQLQVLAERFFDFALEREPHFRFLFLSSARPSSSEHRDSVQAMSKPTFMILRDAIQSLCETEQLNLVDLNRATVDTLAFCVGQAALVISGNLIPDASQDTRDALRAAFARYIAANYPEQKRTQ